MTPFASMLPRQARWPLALFLAIAAMMLMFWPRTTPAPRAHEAQACSCKIPAVERRDPVHEVPPQFAQPPPAAVHCRYPLSRTKRVVGAVPAHWTAR